MSDVKTITIPSLTEGKEPYKVAIPKITANRHREMLLLQAVNEIKMAKEACEEAEEAYRLAEVSSTETFDLVEALETAEADPALILNQKNKFLSCRETAEELKRKLKKVKDALEKDIAKVEKHFGNVPELEIEDLELTYLLIGKDVLGEPWAVMACCNLGPEEWIDIDYEDYANICKELLRRNPRFFGVRHRKAV